MMKCIATVAKSTCAIKFVHIKAIHTINNYVTRSTREGTALIPGCSNVGWRYIPNKSLSSG